MIDHVHEDELPPHVDHTAILTRQVITSPGVVGQQSLSGEVLYHGIGMSIPPGSVQAFSALSAESTAYSAVPGAVLTDMPALVGNDIVLAALVQTRNNARVAVAGSIDMFSNKYYRALVGVRRTKEFMESANEAFCTAISKWVFHEAGVLRVTDLKHHHKAGGPQPASYRINDELVFSLSIEELVDGSWQPYRADDLQVDFVMLDPHVRTTLEHNNTGVFSTNIKVPDVYGVFKFVIDYHRPGYSYIELSEQIPVRPYRHNEFDRFLVPAYPYYASALSTMAAFLLLGFVFLYHK